MLIETLLFGAILLFAVRPLLKRWMRHVLATEGEQISFTTLTMMLTLVFCAAMITNLIGIFSIFGAFMIGAVLFDQEKFRRAVALRLRDFVYVFFVPIFFMYTGLRTDIGTMSGPLIVGAVCSGDCSGDFGQRRCLRSGQPSWRPLLAGICFHGSVDEHQRFNGTCGAERWL